MDLINFIIRARSQRWCNQIGCTTCGAQDFRNALKRELAEFTEVGTACGEPTQRVRDSILGELTCLDFDSVVQLCVSATGREQNVLRQEVEFDVGLILQELGYARGIGTPRSILGGQVAELADRWSAQISARENRRQANIQNNSPEAAAARKKTRQQRVRRIKRRIDHRFDVAIEHWLRCSAKERLSILLDVNRGVPIDAFQHHIDADLISAVAELSDAEKRQLLLVVDKRKGIWSKLSKAAIG